jgi:hypothetical protein
LIGFKFNLHRLQLIADSSGAYGPFDRVGRRGAAINNSGTVVFSAYNSSSGAEAIYIGSGGAITKIVDNSGAFGQFAGFPDGYSINNLGQIAFIGHNRTQGNSHELGRGYGIYLASHGQLFTILDTTGPWRKFTIPSINDSGSIAFKGTPVSAIIDCPGSPHGCYTNPPGIFVVNGGGQLIKVDDRGNDYVGPGLTSSGNTAFITTYTGGPIGVFTGNGGPVNWIVTNTNSPLGLFYKVAINDLNTTAFIARNTNPSGYQEGVYVSNGGGVFNTIAIQGPNIGPDKYTSFSGLAMNNSGKVAFHAWYNSRWIVDPTWDDGGYWMFDMGICTGPNPLTSRVIGTGDALFGSRVVTVGTIGVLTPITNPIDPWAILPDGINDSGQVAFVATLEDGREVVARATPLQ